MPRIRRRFLLDPAEIGVYHCINRCVRRAYLCGQDPVSGKDFEHRRQWIQDRMQFLAGQFGVDVLGFAVCLGPPKTMRIFGQDRQVPAISVARRTPGIILDPHERQYGVRRGVTSESRLRPAHPVGSPSGAEMTRCVDLCRRNGEYAAVSGRHSTDRGWPLVRDWLQFAFGGRV